MSKEISKAENNNQPAVIDEKLITEYMDSYNIAAQLTDKEKMQFISIAKAYQLNPFKKEIYCIAYGQGERRKLSLITGYEVYLKRAERTGKLDGWKVAFVSNGQDMKASIEIHRKDWKMPLTHEVYLSEYQQDTAIWKNKPRTMLKKVAMAQGFRLAFPDELGGIPYDASEIPEGNEIKFVNKAPVISESEESIKIVQEILDKFNACKKAEELINVGEYIKSIKHKLSNLQMESLKKAYNDIQEKLMGT